MKNYLEKIESNLKKAKYWSSKFPESKKWKKRLEKYMMLYKDHC